MLDLARHLTKGYTVQIPGKFHKANPWPPTNLEKLTDSSFFWLQGLGQLGQKFTESFSRATNATFAGVAILCDSLRDRDEHAPIYMYGVSKSCSLSIVGSGSVAR